MIRHKNRIFEEYSICPVTGDIFDAKTGVVQPVKIANGRSFLKNMPVHRIMVHTFYGYKAEMDIHHLDENKLNNSLNNLVYLTPEEHTSLHKKGKPFSAEHKANLSAAHKGKRGCPCSEETKAKIIAALKGKSFSNEHKENIRKAALRRWAERRNENEL